jgi:hypothetical protein
LLISSLICMFSFLFIMILLIHLICLMDVCFFRTYSFSFYESMFLFW